MRPLAAVALSLVLSLSLAAQTDTQADLATTPAQPPQQRLAAGSLMRFGFTLLNSGPAHAKNVRVTFDIPAGVTLHSIYGDDTVCDDLAARPLRCRIVDEISPRENFIRFFSLETTAPVAAATYTFRATAESDNDPNPSNNIVAATYEYALISDLNVLFGPGGRIDPGDSFVLTTQIANYAETIPARNLRVRYTIANARIESIDAPPQWTCTIAADGASAQCTAPALDPDCRCAGLRVTARANGDREGAVIRASATATNDVPDQYEPNNTAHVAVQTYRTLAVTTTADAGAGSLRDVIEQANRACGEPPCKIVFEIAEPLPANGWHTIVPATPLPPVTALNVFIDARTQQRINGDANPHGPEVALDGRVAGRGLEVHSPCEAVVQGLAIGNFFENQGLWVTRTGDCRHFGQRLVANNFIGVAPDGVTAWPNLRGLRLDMKFSGVSVSDNVISGNRYSGIWMWQGAAGITRNRIGTAADGIAPLPNGASGMLLGPEASANVTENTIAHNREMGIALVRGSSDILIGGNSIRDNGGLGIDWGLDGVSPVDSDDRDTATNAPVLLAARYDPSQNRTSVTLRWKTVPLHPHGSHRFAVSFYANRGPDAEGEEPLPLAHSETANIDGRPFELLLAGDHRGKWLTATGTRWHYVQILGSDARAIGPVFGDQFLTSEFSNAVFVP